MVPDAPHAALFLLFVVALVARAASAIPDGENMEKYVISSDNSFSVFDKQIGRCLMSGVIKYF